MKKEIEDEIARIAAAFILALVYGGLLGVILVVLIKIGIIKLEGGL